MKRSLGILSVVGLVCMSILIGLHVSADSTVRFQLEIIPAEDREDEDNNDDDDEDDDPNSPPPLIGNTIGTPDEAQVTNVGDILRHIIPETVVAASPSKEDDDRWCAVTFSRSAVPLVLINALLVVGATLWMIGVWLFLPRRAICINGYAYIRKSRRQ